MDHAPEIDSRDWKGSRTPEVTQSCHEGLATDQRRNTSAIYRPYCNYRNEMSCYAGLMFEGIRIIIAHSLRPETLQCMHAAQLGVDKCRVRARTAVFWPGINAAIDDLVSQCSTCQQHQRRSQR